MPNFTLSDAVFQQAAAQFPTPFHLYNEAGIRTRARTLNQAFSWCSDFQEYFAVKALPNPTILRILKEEGCGVDCSSETELMLAEALGFSGRDIMFSANAMPNEEFDHARRLEAFVNLDDISHIDILREHGGIPEIPLKAKAYGEEKLAQETGVGLPTLKDMIAELQKPGRDPRDELPKPVLRTDVLDMKDLTPGMELTGTVRNVIDFGAFVDIGVHQDGLVHISRIADRFIRHPSEVLKVGDVVKVWVVSVDEKKQRIALTMVKGKM